MLSARRLIEPRHSGSLSDLDPSFKRALDVEDAVFEGFGAALHGEGQVVDLFTGFGERGAMRPSLQQFCIELLLKTIDRTSNRRDGGVERPGRRGETPQTRDRPEDTYVVSVRLAPHDIDHACTCASATIRWGA